MNSSRSSEMVSGFICAPETMFVDLAFLVVFPNCMLTLVAYLLFDDYGFLQTEKFKYNYNNTTAFTCDMTFYSCLCPTNVEFKSVYDIKFYQIMLPLE